MKATFDSLVEMTQVFVGHLTSPGGPVDTSKPLSDFYFERRGDAAVFVRNFNSQNENSETVPCKAWEVEQPVSLSVRQLASFKPWDATPYVYATYYINPVK